MSKKKNWKKRDGVVFSTNPDFNYAFKDALDGLGGNNDSGAVLKVRPEKKGRNGKTVTVVQGFEGSSEEFKKLATELKTKCGVGGSAKEGEILIQGDFVEKVLDILKEKGYQAKRSGG
ncbi:MAG: translation initiation factor [Bacteroidota bacterium]